MGGLKLVENRRILIVDDTTSIHDDFRRILAPDSGRDSLAEAEMMLFGSTGAGREGLVFELEFANDGPDALKLVHSARRYSRPFAMAFIDVRMGPGWDGIETTRRIWMVDPNIEVVLCTAYSDQSWHQITQKLGLTDRLLILKKPFDGMEVRQLALALTMKWCLSRKTEDQQRNADQVILSLQKELDQCRNGAPGSAAVGS